MRCSWEDTPDKHIAFFCIVLWDLFPHIDQLFDEEIQLVKAGKQMSHRDHWLTTSWQTFCTMCIHIFCCHICHLQSICFQRMYMMIRRLLAYRPCHARLVAIIHLKFVNESQIYISIPIMIVEDQIWLKLFGTQLCFDRQYYTTFCDMMQYIVSGNCWFSLTWSAVMFSSRNKRESLHMNRAQVPKD